MYNIHMLNASNALTYNPGGYDLDKIQNGIMHQELKDSLICGICLLILREPMECDNCRKLFCKSCIEKWQKNCPFQCPGILRVRPCSHILQEFIYVLKVTCQSCNELVLFPLINEHEEWCRKDKCANKQCQAILEYRSRKEFKFQDMVTIQVCDDICYEMFRLQQALKLSKDGNAVREGAAGQNSGGNLPVNAAEFEQFKILQEQEGYKQDWAARNAREINFKQALQYFNDFFQEQEEDEMRQKRAQIEEEQKSLRQSALRGNQQAIVPLQNREQMLQENISSAQMPALKAAASGGGNMGNPELKQRMEQLRLQREIVGVLITSFVWEIDPRYAKLLSVSDDRRGIYLKEDDYFFRTFFGDVIFTEGIHYWEIVADARTEHELKIGVSKSKECDQRTAFCDYEFGWAFFGVGQLRHNSNAQGASYGRVFKRQGVLGIFLNMNKGTLSFAIDGQYFGVAFEDEQLKSGPIYPAVSILHNAGCTLVSGRPPPFYFFE